MDTAAFVYSDFLARFDYGDDHPFKPIRAKNTMELCNRHGLLYSRGVSRPEPQPAASEDLTLYHTSEYLGILRRASAGEHDIEILTAGIGTPDCPALAGVYEFSRYVAGATLAAVDLVDSGEAARAFNPVGGLHHGFPNHAEGFCYINDVGIALCRLLGRGRRVAFVDIDAHHCNGVQHGFFDTDQALIISLHEFEEGFYPETGRVDEIGVGNGKGFTVNVPLLKKSDDEVYVEIFERIVPPLLEAYRPDIVVAEIGADTMISDPLTGLRLTSNGYEAVVKRLCECAPRLAALGGGGYDIHRTANCWTLAFGAMAGIEPEDEFAGLVGGMMYGGELGGLHDMKILTKGPEKEAALQYARQNAETIEKTVFPMLGAKTA